MNPKQNNKGVGFGGLVIMSVVFSCINLANVSLANAGENGLKEQPSSNSAVTDSTSTQHDGANPPDQSQVTVNASKDKRDKTRFGNSSFTNSALNGVDESLGDSSTAKSGNFSPQQLTPSVAGFSK